MELVDLVKKVSEYNLTNVPKIIKAYNYAASKHAGQKRASGEDYIIHPLNVAYILADMGADTDTICAGLLHDVIEDTDSNKEIINMLFGDKVANLVDGVTKLSNMKFNNPEEEENANMRKLITGATEDIRIIIIKLADVLHNMRTLQYKSKLKQREKALSTMEIFAPLADRIGAYRIRTELEDLSLKYLYPNDYNNICQEISKISIDSQGCLNEILSDIDQMLSIEGIPHEIKLRTKNVYGIYKKLKNNEQYVNMHDLFALKIMVDDIKNCYLSMFLVHSRYKPINNGELKDYICNPKNNLYRSLHSTVFGPDGRLIQSQIRTFEMDKVASFGLTAFWNINGGNARENMQSKIKRSLLNPISDINSTISNDTEFVDRVKQELFNDYIYVYTKDGKTIGLPKGSTPIDFAYHIHTAIGNAMVGVLVNGVSVPFGYELNQNDCVEIITSDETKGLGLEWMDVAKTTRAKRKIKENNKSMTN